MFMKLTTLCFDWKQQSKKEEQNEETLENNK